MVDIGDATHVEDLDTQSDSLFAVAICGFVKRGSHTDRNPTNKPPYLTCLRHPTSQLARVALRYHCGRPGRLRFVHRAPINV